ncbi:MAG TPA: hypothetical protein PLP39_07185 [Flavobacterium lutivivi]|nr:hypothetical protein [Flavobacterium lutivivi]
MKLSRIILIVSFVVFSHNSVFATGQTPDYLIVENDTLSLHCNPLESYFEKNPIPEGIITNLSTALWRGYVAYFKLINNKLVVENIYKEEFNNDEKGNHIEKLVSIYDKIFGSVPNFECNFYSGVLICPYGKILNYVHMGYSSNYENYRLIEIQNGQYTKEVNMNADEFMTLKIKNFAKYKQTEEYKKQLQETINSFKVVDENLEDGFKEIKRKNKKRKKKNKYLYEKERDAEYIKSAENFIFIFTTNNIKTIDIN